MCVYVCACMYGYTYVSYECACVGVCILMQVYVHVPHNVYVYVHFFLCTLLHVAVCRDACV